MENREPEVWKPIPGYEGIYEVSSWGFIKSLDLYVSTKNKGLRLRKGRLRKPSFSKKYPQIILSKKGVNSCCKVHFIVAKVFLGFIEGEGIVNHKDLNRGNNYYKNIEIVNIRENTSHYFRSLENKSSIYIGVCFEKGRYKKPWRASFYHDRKVIRIGRFSTEIEAHNAYLTALKKYKLKNKYAEDQ